MNLQLPEWLYRIYQYLDLVTGAIRRGLWPTDDLLSLLGYPTGRALSVVLGVVFLAGCSLLFGQSVILFLNRVPPWRFVASLCIHGLMLIGGYFVSGLVIWLAGRILIGGDEQFVAVLQLIGLSYSPLVFGFLILIPYFGAAIEKVLYLWSAFILLVCVRFEYGTDLLRALLVVGLAYVLRSLLAATLGRPVMALRRSMLRRALGSERLELSPVEIRERVAASLRDRVGGDQ